MNEKFRAILISKTDQGQTCNLVELGPDDLMEGDVTVAVAYSTVNYKDGLAITGKSPIARVWPLIPGVDFAGVVETSAHKDFKPGDKVVLNSWGVGEGHHGGFAQKARVKGDWLVKLPEGLSLAQSMAIGTAGYTAMLCVMALEKAGVNPKSGDVVVTGAAGGVGSVAVSLLANLGYRVIASTGRPAEADYLTSLGASEIIERKELSGPARALGKQRWAGAVDSVGSHTLANVLSMTNYGGAVAACGLAQGMDLPGSVAPFILRGVTLIGIDSVMAPIPKRIEAYNRLVRDLDLKKLDLITSRAVLADVQGLAADIVNGNVRGRVVIDVNA